MTLVPTPPVVPRHEREAYRRLARRVRHAHRVQERRAERGPVNVRLWLPLTPLFVLLAPFAVLLAAFGYLAPPRYRPDPFAAVIALGALLMALSGTDIAIDAHDTHVRLKIL